MGWLSKLAGLTDVLKLDVLMSFDVLAGEGVAAFRWAQINSYPALTYDQSRIATIGLLYARTLVNESGTRVELFERVGRAARRVVGGATAFPFEPWQLRIAGKDFQLWPWMMADPDRIADAKTYTAMLQSTAAGSLSIHLKMALGQDRVLSPSCPLIAIAGVADVLPLRERHRLAQVLLEVNAHYQSPANIRLGSDRSAMASAMGTLRAP